MYEAEARPFPILCLSYVIFCIRGHKWYGKRSLRHRLFHHRYTRPSTTQSYLQLRLQGASLTQIIQGISATTQATSHAEHSPGLQHPVQWHSLHTVFPGVAWENQRLGRYWSGAVNDSVTHGPWSSEILQFHAAFAQQGYLRSWDRLKNGWASPGWAEEGWPLFLCQRICSHLVPSGTALPCLLSIFWSRCSGEGGWGMGSGVKADCLPWLKKHPWNCELSGEECLKTQPHHGHWLNHSWLLLEL